MKSILKRWTGILFALFLCYLPAHAQGRDTVVSGTVATTWEVSVADATVTLTNRQTGATQTSTSNKDGEYRLATTPGFYDLSVSAAGFHPSARQNIRLGEATLRVALRLQPEKDDFAVSVKPLEAAIAGKPDDYVAQFNLGRAYFAGGNADKAGEAFAKALELHPDYLPARLGLVHCALQRGNAGGAITNAQEALKSKPDSGVAKLLEATAYLRTSQFAESERLLNGMLGDNPYDTDAMTELGTLNVAQKKFQEAEDSFGRAYALDPFNMRAVMGIADVHLLMKEPEKAVQTISAAWEKAEKEPLRRDLRRELAAIEFRAKQYDKAIADYQSILDQYKDSPVEQAGILARIGEVYAQTDDLERSIDNLKKATQLAPENGELRYSLARVYERAGKNQEALASYRSVLKIEPNSALTLNNLAYLMADTGGDLDEALSMAQLARRQLPKSVDVLDTIGWIYLKKNLTDSAVRVFRDLAEKFNTNPTFHFHYAMALSQKGDREGALKEFNSALQSKPRKEEEAAIQAAIGKLSEGRK